MTVSGLESATAITHDQLAERDGRMRPADADMRLATTWAVPDRFPRPRFSPGPERATGGRATAPL